jgi:DNA-directed RNA polymerase specialized sigma24 family protein
MGRTPVADNTNPVNSIAPLTRPDPQRPGKVYERPDQVEKQVSEALALGAAELVRRSQVRNYNAPEYFQEESLVYLIRKYLGEDNQELVNALVTELIGRCAKRINSKIQTLLDPVYIEDCFRDAVAALFEQILDLENDRGDFAQVRFWVFLDARVSNVLRGYMKRQSEDRQTDALDLEPDDADFNPSVNSALRTRGEGIIEQAEILEGLEVLEQPLRNAYIMRHYGDWEIENKDPNAPTISKHFGVSPRTVRRWLATADEKLQLRRGDLR